MVHFFKRKTQTRGKPPKLAEMSDFDEFERQLSENKQGEQRTRSGRAMNLPMPLSCLAAITLGYSGSVYLLEGKGITVARRRLKMGPLASVAADRLLRALRFLQQVNPTDS